MYRSEPLHDMDGKDNTGQRGDSMAMDGEVLNLGQYFQWGDKLESNTGTVWLDDGLAGRA